MTESEHYKGESKRLWEVASSTYAAQAHDGCRLLLPMSAEVTREVNAYCTSAEPLHILDLASGSGEPALTLARAFPASTITAIDIAEGMLAEGRRRAYSMGLTNVRFVVGDAEDLEGFADDSADVLCIIFGIMFLPHYRRALQGFKRVLKPGGLVIITVWAEAARTDITRLLGQTKARLAPTEKGLGNPHSFADSAELRASLADVGFSSIQEREVVIPMRITAEAFPDAIMMPVMWDLLEKLQQKDPSVSKAEITETAKLIAAENKFMQPDGNVVMPRNTAIMITGTA